MSDRPNIQPFPVITNGDMSGNIISLVTLIPSLTMISYSCNWSGTSPVGVVSVQVSNDYSVNADGSVRNSGTWSTLPLSVPTNVSGNTGNGFIDINMLSGFAARLVYTAISGSGLFQAKVVCKVG